ncbi:MAG: hypothetical protein QOF51_1477 [Chloroflexota bacterium]|jgi:hypothetical protein|nr:hypothetical protein [Chloroflexota bacterium]
MIERQRDYEYVERRPDLEVVEPAPVAEAAHVDSVVVDPQATQAARVFRLTEAIYLLFGFIEALIAIRFVLRALGANPQSGFAAAIYAVTGPLVAPFSGIFGVPQFNGSVLEPHSVVAIIVYALLAWLIARLAWLMMADTRSEVSSHVRSVRTRTPR